MRVTMTSNPLAKGPRQIKRLNLWVNENLGGKEGNVYFVHYASSAHCYEALLLSALSSCIYIPQRLKTTEANPKDDFLLPSLFPRTWETHVFLVVQTHRTKTG